MVEYVRFVSDSVLVPFMSFVALFFCPLLHCMVHVKGSPCGSFMGMVQVKLCGLPVDPLFGVGVPNTGGRFALVVKVYHFLVYELLPVGSVALTQIL